MQIDNMKGEFFYRALIRTHGSDFINEQGFKLTELYYASREDVCADCPVGTDIRWPVEEVDRGVMYIPALEEYV